MILGNGVFDGKRVVDAAALSPESQTQPPGDGQGTSNYGSASMSANESCGRQRSLCSIVIR